jgi:hypothetical protein
MLLTLPLRHSAARLLARLLRHLLPAASRNRALLSGLLLLTSLLAMTWVPWSTISAWRAMLTSGPASARPLLLSMASVTSTTVRAVLLERCAHAQRSPCLLLYCSLLKTRACLACSRLLSTLQVDLAPFPDPPEPLASLFNGTDPRSNHFLTNIRSYNSAFQMASSRIRQDPNITSGTHSFRVSGRIHHMIGPLLPGDGQEHAFAQIYMYDSDADANARRRGIFAVTREDVLNDIQFVMHTYNPYVQGFRQVARNATEPGAPQDMHLTLVTGAVAPGLAMRC